MRDIQGDPKGLSIGGLVVINKSMSLTVKSVFMSWASVVSMNFVMVINDKKKKKKNCVVTWKKHFFFISVCTSYLANEIFSEPQLQYGQCASLRGYACRLSKRDFKLKRSIHFRKAPYITLLLINQTVTMF